MQFFCIECKITLREWGFDMDEITLESGSQASFEDLRNAMNAAFVDYQVPLTLMPEAFAMMMRQRGLDRNASTVAIFKGEIAAFWLMSIRGDAAYLISSGTLPQFRGKGMSTKIAHDVIDKLRAANVSTFQTEVLENNEVAQKLYARVGMTQQRQLGCCTISPVRSTPVQDVEIAEHPWVDLQSDAASMRDWFPSWQHSDASLAALGEDVVCFCATKADEIVGVVAFIKGTNTVAQIAVRKGFRRNGVGRALINAVVPYASGNTLRVINFSAADTGFTAFLEAHHAQRMVGQFELGLRL